MKIYLCLSFQPFFVCFFVTSFGKANKAIENAPEKSARKTTIMRVLSTHQADLEESNVEFSTKPTSISHYQEIIHKD